MCEIFSRRRQQGEYHNFLQEMRVSDPESHFIYLIMPKERFDSLLSKVCTFVIAILTLSNLRSLKFNFIFSQGWPFFNTSRI